MFNLGKHNLAMIGPTGGLGYHLTAWRFSRQWQPFRENVRSWLERWAPSEKRLVLFGPSAGYSLPLSFLEKFERIDVIEPDAMARFLLSKRFAALKPRIHFDDAYEVLPWWTPDEPTSGETLRRFLHDRATNHGPAAILFANFLGQLPLLKTNHDDPRLRQGFLNALSHYSWASYHDLFSGRNQDFNQCPDSILLKGEVEALARKFFKNEAEVIDHGTTWLGDGTALPVCRWQFTSKHIHVIAFMSRERT